MFRATKKKFVKQRLIDNAIIWQETAEKLTAFYKEEGFTYSNIIDALYPAIENFEKLLYEEDEKKNEKI